MNALGIQTADKLKDAGVVCGGSAVMQSLNAMVEQLAATNIPVLLVGESGTGKDVYARMLHRLSGQNVSPFVKISCGTIDHARLQSALQNLHTPKEDAQGATHLFLDGIEELDGLCQKLLLIYLPDGVEWGGEPSSRVRVISATSRDLEQEVQSGRFRRELYFRINGACLRLPPLRERRDDISTFLGYFLEKHAIEMKKPVPEVDRETMDLLLAYDWPGNIRELENLSRRMVAFGGERLPLDDLCKKFWDRPDANDAERGTSLKSAARAASRQRERELILEALERTKWNRKRAAQELQVSYKALLYKLKQIGELGKGAVGGRNK